MPQYPVAVHPSDNASLWPYYGSGLHFQCKFIRYGDGRPPSLWLLRNTPESLACMDALFNSDDPPTTRPEALERAGATFFPIWYQCENIRIWEVLTKATSMAFKRLERIEHHFRLAKDELDQNVYHMTEDRISEERKTLEWVRGEMQKERNVRDGSVMNGDIEERQLGESDIRESNASEDQVEERHATHG
ncbi:hypothetical protein B0O99DRAFT_605866 [Bisporella sp. PMI_857]|nr:hypothetical protein B0O99DRAFT_605866 [Bisporella sp. PMI_857]